MVGRISDTSAISMRPISSGKNRSRATTCSAVSAGAPVRLSPRLTSLKLHLAGREQRHRGIAAQHRIKPGDAADFSLDRLAHRVRRHHQPDRQKRAKHHGDERHNGKSKAFDADGRSHEASFCLFGAETSHYGGAPSEALQPFCDAFVAAVQQ